MLIWPISEGSGEVKIDLVYPNYLQIVFSSPLHRRYSTYDIHNLLHPQLRAWPVLHIKSYQIVSVAVAATDRNLILTQRVIGRMERA